MGIHDKTWAIQCACKYKFMIYEFFLTQINAVDMTYFNVTNGGYK